MEVAGHVMTFQPADREGQAPTLLDLEVQVEGDRPVLSAEAPNQPDALVVETARAGRAVRLSELQAGDLVFFAIDGGTVDHVGIYVGDAEFIHAPRRYVPVSLESLHNAWWRRHFRTARRLR